MPPSIPAGGLEFQFDAKIAGLEAKFDRVVAAAEKMEKQLERTGSKGITSFQKLGKAFEVAANGIATGAVVIGAGITKSVVTFAKFEKTMVRVGAITGTLGTKTFDALATSARNLAQTTEFSGSQVGDAMSFMAMAGFDANKILAATPKVLQLASAAMMDVAQAADITTNIMSGYGMKAEELGRANDVLVKAMTSSNTNLQQLGEAFKYAGPVAKGAGIAFEEAASALGLMGNAGIQASMAGTSLRGAVSRLLAPTKQVQELMDKFGLGAEIADGKIKSLTGILRRLEVGGAQTGEMMELFGLRAGPAMAALVEQGTAALEDMNEKLLDSEGIAERIATEQLKTLSGQWAILTSNVEELETSLGQLVANDQILPWLSEITGKLANFVSDAPSFGDILGRMWLGMKIAIYEVIRALNVFFAKFGVMRGLLGGESVARGLDAWEQELIDAAGAFESKMDKVAEDIAKKMRIDAMFNVAGENDAFSNEFDKTKKPFFLEFPARKPTDEKTEAEKEAIKKAEQAAKELAKAQEALAEAFEKLAIDLRASDAARVGGTAQIAADIGLKFEERLEEMSGKILAANGGIAEFDDASNKLAAIARNEAIEKIKGMDLTKDLNRADQQLIEMFEDLHDAGKITGDAFGKISKQVKDAFSEQLQIGVMNAQVQNIIAQPASGSKVQFQGSGLKITGRQAFNISQSEEAKAEEKAAQEREAARKGPFSQAAMETLGNIMGGSFQGAAFSAVGMTDLGQTMGGGFLGVASGLVDMFIKGVEDVMASAAFFLNMGTDFIASVSSGSPRTQAFLGAMGGGVAGVGGGAAAGGTLGAVGGSVVGAVLSGPLAPLGGVAGGVIGGAMGTAGGAGLGGLMGFLTPLISASEKFDKVGKAFEMAMEPAIKALAPLASSALALAPVMGVLAETLVKMAVMFFQSFGGMKLFWSGLTLATQVVVRFAQVGVEAVEWLSRINLAFASLNLGITELQIGMATFLQSIGMSTGPTEDMLEGRDEAQDAVDRAQQGITSMENFGGALDDLANGLPKSFEEAMAAGGALADGMDEAMEEVGNAASEAAGSLFNVPVGFKINAARMAAIDTTGPAKDPRAEFAEGVGLNDFATGAIATGNQANYNIYIDSMNNYGVKDPQEFASALNDLQENLGLQHDGNHQNGLFNNRGGGPGSPF
jgi:TP901 family phage tail tape measure protein